ncbi:YeiH family putative sulfate export transporter [Sporolactobacillus shoreae]|uniref:YeiH family putative sulfate export transporter n=1 Tax=Sporolactobacillus shoreae TaxID=1465501 RepID=A0A4Z0GL12_9BACL|nr:YeiH family protein [Sporolactobacillus shoreae]TGA97615.1 YeiH family putative sulfate export transporter [Sporolactobacillus shoreae]
MKIFTIKLPGIILAAVLAIPACLIGTFFPLVGSPILGILSGMLLSVWRRPVLFEEGIKYTSKKVLQYSVVLMGFGLNLFNIIKVGSQTLELLVFTLAAAFLTAYIAGKLLKIEGKTQTLIGVGTAICGGSAIAAAAPVIRADEKEVAHAISTIFLFNVIAAFLFPFLGHVMGMSNQSFGLWTGTAVNDTSSVVAAGYTFSHAAGNLAVIVKLTRTLMIIPVTLVLSFYYSRKTTQKGQGGYHFSKVFPWFVLGFVTASVISTFLPLPVAVINFLVQCGKYLIVMAMVSIGLNTNVVKLVKNGGKPIVLGFICWGVLSIVSLAVQWWL